MSGVESRLATLTLDMDDLNKLPGLGSHSELPSSFRDISQLVTTLPAIFNSLNVRRAIIPAANGHCSARALARYYAALVDGGLIPPPHSSSSKPPLGSHTHIPKFPSLKTSNKQEGGNVQELTMASTRTNGPKQLQNLNNSFDTGHGKKVKSTNYMRLATDSSCSNSSNPNTVESSEVDGHGNNGKIFSNPKIHDAFLGAGEYENLVFPNGMFGLGFKRVKSKDGSFVGFGHSGMGGSTGYCDINNRFAIAVTLNKMSFGAVTRNIIQLVCSELDIPLPEEFSKVGERGPYMQLNLETPLIN
ncbi:unnamed protein product [Ilex paraguariensis]|uniref:Beta-lactamase-related domain-containing protein n=1 Tax=Ilex paraguariensis TaxID=185542 RepID=A0ABC8UWT3_9AQUA